MKGKRFEVKNKLLFLFVLGIFVLIIFGGSVEGACSDSDSNQDGVQTIEYTTSGYASDSSHPAGYDYCAGNSIGEYYCSSGVRKNTETDAITGNSVCPNNFFCKALSNGAKCVQCTSDSQCGSTQVCVNNACVAATCTDSDGSAYGYQTMELLDSGFVTFGSDEFKDDCLSGSGFSGIHEQSCASATARLGNTEDRYCSSAYPDTLCYETSSVPAFCRKKCIDSDDAWPRTGTVPIPSSDASLLTEGRVDFSYVTGVENSSTDICVDNDGVREWYCNNIFGTGNDATATCPSGKACRDGRCEIGKNTRVHVKDQNGGNIDGSDVSSTYHTLSGADSGAYGFPANTKTSNGYTSTKILAAGVWTFSASKGTVQNSVTTNVIAGSGTQTVDITLQAATCTDTDNSANPPRNGEDSTKTKGSALGYTDRCPIYGDSRDTTMVVEAYCNSPTTATQTAVNCPSGYSCSDGACVTSAPTCTDADGDGHITQDSITGCGKVCGAHTPPNQDCIAGQDCDDTNEYIYQGASEICNGKDDDCDGTIDELPDVEDNCGSGKHCANRGTPSATCENDACVSDADCADTSACTINERCVSGSCTRDPLNCDDGLFCKDDSCNSATGCIHTPKTCDDSIACTTNDCDETNNMCANNPIVDCGGEDVCGNGEITGSEECDGANLGSYGDGIDKCKDYSSTTYDKGNLTCDTTSCQIKTDKCSTSESSECGDLMLNQFCSDFQTAAECNRCEDLGISDRRYDSTIHSDPKCKWDGDSCEFNPKNKLTGELCTVETLSYSCPTGKTTTTIEYTDSCNLLCNTAGKKCIKENVPCPQFVELPFFGKFEFVLSVIVIGGIYGYLVYRKRR